MDKDKAKRLTAVKEDPKDTQQKEPEKLGEVRIIFYKEGSVQVFYPGGWEPLLLMDLVGKAVSAIASDVMTKAIQKKIQDNLANKNGGDQGGNGKGKT